MALDTGVVGVHLETVAGDRRLRAGCGLSLHMATDALVRNIRPVRRRLIGRGAVLQFPNRTQ